MGRPPRIDIPGLVYHVLETRKRYAIEIEQYSLMTNHFHFLLRLHEGSLSQAMKFLLSRYAYINSSLMMALAGLILWKRPNEKEQNGEPKDYLTSGPKRNRNLLDG